MQNKNQNISEDFLRNLHGQMEKFLTLLCKEKVEDSILICVFKISPEVAEFVLRLDSYLNSNRSKSRKQFLREFIVEVDIPFLEKLLRFWLNELTTRKEDACQKN